MQLEFDTGCRSKFGTMGELRVMYMLLNKVPVLSYIWLLLQADSPVQRQSRDLAVRSPLQYEQIWHSQCSGAPHDPQSCG